MKHLIIIVLLLFSLNTYAGFLPWGKAEKIEEPPEEIEEVKKEPEIYHKALWVSGDKEKVFYLYRFIEKDGVPDLIQVGIIDEAEMSIQSIEDGKKTGEYKYYGDNKKLEYLDANFPNITPQEFYKKSP